MNSPYVWVPGRKMLQHNMGKLELILSRIGWLVIRHLHCGKFYTAFFKKNKRGMSVCPKIQWYLSHIFKEIEHLVNFTVWKMKGWTHPAGLVTAANAPSAWMGTKWALGKKWAHPLPSQHCSWSPPTSGTASLSLVCLSRNWEKVLSRDKSEGWDYV